MLATTAESALGHAGRTDREVRHCVRVPGASRRRESAGGGIAAPLRRRPGATRRWRASNRSSSSPDRSTAKRGPARRKRDDERNGPRRPVGDRPLSDFSPPQCRLNLFIIGALRRTSAARTVPTCSAASVPWSVATLNGIDRSISGVCTSNASENASARSPAASS